MSVGPYQVLTFRANLRNCPDAQPGMLLGWDVFDRPYEIIDTEWFWCTGCTARHGNEGYTPKHCPVCGGAEGHTRVYLQPATPEHVKAQIEAVQIRIGLLVNHHSPWGDGTRKVAS